jgi:DNA-binding GntR family transcriptional regulator
MQFTSPLLPAVTKAARPLAKSRRVSADTGKDVAAPQALTTDQIYERILTAIMEHRLPPGTQLVEDRLASIFDVSRTKIREATVRLVHDRVATNIPNRGAFIASPTPDEARQVFAARRLIEPGLVRQAAEKATPRQIGALRSHIAREAKARAGKDPYTLVPLTGEFHLMLAEIAGNGYLARTLRELELITCLCIILYDAPGSHSCLPNEHEQLLAAIEARNGDKAASLMLHHLEHIEHGLNLAPRVDDERSLEDAFR